MSADEGSAAKIFTPTRDFSHAPACCIGSGDKLSGHGVCALGLTAPTKQANATEGQLPPWSLCWLVLAGVGSTWTVLLHGAKTAQRRRKDGAIPRPA